MGDVRRKSESMFKEFQLLYEADREANDILAIEEVDPDDDGGFDINEWRFGGGIASKENKLQRYLKTPVVTLGTMAEHKSFEVCRGGRQIEGNIRYCHALPSIFMQFLVCKWK